MDGPAFHPSSVPSSSHKDYRPKAIQIHGRSKFEGRTAHQDDYQQWELPKQEQHGPLEGFKKHIPFNGSSTYSDIYKAHPLERHVPKEAQPYRGSMTKFDAASSYARDFVAKELPRQAAILPRTKPASSGKFDATSSYADNYVAHELPVLQVDHGPKYAGVSLPFTATTAYQDEFVPHAIEAHDRNEAQHKARPTPKFEGTSTAHDDYVAHPLQPVSLVHPTRRALANVPFEATTTNHDDFKAWPIDLNRQDHSNKATSIPHRPFNGISTMKEDFQGWKLPSHRETLGVATVGDRLHVLIPAQKSVPATAFQTFTTVHHGQTEMCMMIYEGSNPIASRNKLLGQFQLINIPLAAVGVPRVKVTFKLDANCILTVEAHDMDSERHHAWQSEEGAILALKHEPYMTSAEDSADHLAASDARAIAVC